VKTLRTGSTAKLMALASIKPMQTAMQAGNAERFRLYNQAKWKRLRLAFLKENPLCVLCAEQGIVRASYAADHKLSHFHSGWREDFFDKTKLRSLCMEHHNAHSAQELAEWRRRGYGNGSDDRS
jgi:5-methylcytosine-specific restriction protein A